MGTALSLFGRGIVLVRMLLRCTHQGFFQGESPADVNECIANIQVQVERAQPAGFYSAAGEKNN